MAQMLQNGQNLTQGTLWDKDKIIGVQEELIKKFKQENEELRQKVKELEDYKAKKTKNPTKPNKQKVGFTKKHKPKKVIQ